MRKIVLMLALASTVAVTTARAQLSPPNSVGVSMGHLHLIVKDMEAAKKFWIAFGGTSVKLGPMDVVKFPGVIIVFRQGDPSGGTVGSSVGHFGFQVPNVQAALTKWQAAGLDTKAGVNAQQGFVITSDGLTRIEILEDKSLKVPVAFQHIHFYTYRAGEHPGTTEEVEAWYVKMFGAKPGTYATATGTILPSADLPGVSLRFNPSDTPTVGTKGRVLDHIGFEVRNLEDFCKKGEASGLKFDPPYAKLPELGVSRAYITDPWGTLIELTDGLDRL